MTATVSPPLGAHERARPRSRWSTTDVLLVALVTIGAGLRLWALGSSRLGYDESFTAMAARLSPGDLFAFLRQHDSHPPLDYLLHAPLARLGVSELAFRLPSAIMSITALALFARWMRQFGLAGVIATGLLAISAFQLVHGREARMYAELELIGVGAAVLTYAWLRHPRRWHAPVVGAIVFAGLLTHTSMFLLGAGLLAAAGRRPDREAWRWRGALAAGFSGWAVLWGSSFLVQAGGGHSDWIPRTTPSGVVDVVGKLVSVDPALALPAFVLVIAGALVIRRRDQTLATAWACCCAIPIALAALTGLVAPVLLDRALTVASWGVVVAVAFAIDALRRVSRLAVAGACAAVLLVSLPWTAQAVTNRATLDSTLRRVEAVERSGDVIAVYPAWREPELAWSVGVRSDEATRAVTVTGLPNTAALRIGTGRPSGRIWLIQWRRRSPDADGYVRCAPIWRNGGNRLTCLQLSVSPPAPAP